MDFITNYFQNDKPDTKIVCTNINKFNHWCSIIKSIDKWDNDYYITTDDKDSKMFVLKYNNPNYCYILKSLIIDKLIAFTYIEENTDNIIQNSIMGCISEMSVIILSIETNPDTKISHIIVYLNAFKEVKLILFPTFGNSDLMLNKLKINEIFTLYTVRHDDNINKNFIYASIRDVLDPIIYESIIIVKKLQMIEGTLSNFIDVEALDIEFKQTHFIINKDKEQPKIGSKYYMYKSFKYLYDYRM